MAESSWEAHAAHGDTPYHDCCVDTDCPAITDDPCRVAACRNGTCGSVPANEGGSCDDGNACTQTDTCDSAGNCMGGNPVVCTASDQCHDVGTCDPATGACSNPAKADNTPCGDGIPCTTGETCQRGVCTGGQPVSCDDGRSCTTGRCNPTTGQCDYEVNSGSCLIAGTCYARDAVNGANPCQYCDPDQATDVWSNRPHGSSCADDNRCDGEEACDGQGNCVAGTAVVCPSPNQCQESVVCDPNTGQCIATNKADNTPCDDGNPCTTGETCQSGACTGGQPMTCPPEHTCQGGQCVRTCPGEGQVCGPAPFFECCPGLACADSGVCSGAPCVPGGVCQSDVDCCVGETCTVFPGGSQTGLCLGGGACGEAGQVCCSGGGCNSGNACCGGTCTPLGTSSNCTACGQVCAGTTPFCEPGVGCTDRCQSHSDCDDGNPCTFDQCNQGSCSNTKRNNGTPCGDGLICCGGACVDDLCQL